MTTKLYRRDQLPQWTIEDVIKHDYTYYFGLEHCRRLKPTQFVDDYEEERVDKKREMLEVGQFDPIIVDYDFNIICIFLRILCFVYAQYRMDITKVVSAAFSVLFSTAF